MTRIAYILKMYPRFSETFILNEILELERRGVDIRIYSLRKPDDGRFHPALARVKANVVYVPQYPEMEPERVRIAHEALAAAHPHAYDRLRHHAEGLNQPYGLKRFLQSGVIAAHLMRHPVDALHAHFASSATRVANFVYRLTGIPYSFTAHAKDIFHHEVSPASLVAKMRAARFVVTVSRYNRAYLQSILGDRSGDIRCLYNGIDLKLFYPNSTVNRASNLILGVGRLVEKKGFDQLIKASAILASRGQHFRCEIIGKGDQRNYLQSMIDRLELSDLISLVGPRSQSDVQAAFRRAAVFALPCLVGRDGNRDGLPTVLLEAMATGLPVVTSNLTGNPEIVDHEFDGLLIPSGNPKALADALGSLLQSEELRARMGTAARHKVEAKFDVRHNVALLQRWLAEPVHRPTAAGNPPRLWKSASLPVLPVPPPLEKVVPRL